MIPKYEDYRKTHGSGFAKGTLSRSEYTKVLKGTNDFPSQEVKKIIAEVEVKLAQKRAKEIKKQGSPSEIHKVQPQKTKSKPLKAGNTPSKKANAKKNDDMIPRSEYLKLRFKINELSECYRNDKLKLLKLTSDLWKASGRNFSGEDFQKVFYIAQSLIFQTILTVLCSSSRRNCKPSTLIQGLKTLRPPILRSP